MNINTLSKKLYDKDYDGKNGERLLFIDFDSIQEKLSNLQNEIVEITDQLDLVHSIYKMEEEDEYENAQDRLSNSLDCLNGLYDDIEKIRG